MKRCRVCNSAIEPFMSFGKMPIANGFLAADQVASEYFFELAPAFCNRCDMFQLIEQPPRERMFHENYAFFSSLSREMGVHFKAFANYVMGWALQGLRDPFVIELGSNDGIMLRHFKEAGYRHLGIEPSKNVADVAQSQGIETICDFLSLELAKQIACEKGLADAVVAANVLCHIADINAAATAITDLLTTDGILIFEDPYLGDMVKKTSYDQIYDEHTFIFSATSVSWLFAQHGLELIEVKPQWTHGGSMRYVLGRKGRRVVSPSVDNLLEKEHTDGLDSEDIYRKFKQNCEASREKLRKLLEAFRRDGKRVVGYGATSKSTTVMNYCGIGPEHIEFISDTTPIKQGKLTPGSHIPIRPYEAFVQNPPDYAILFAWNHAEEIFAKEKAFIAGGGRWIRFVPDVEVIT